MKSKDFTPEGYHCPFRTRQLEYPSGEINAVNELPLISISMQREESSYLVGILIEQSSV